LKRATLFLLCALAAGAAPAARADTPVEKARKLSLKLATHKDPRERASAASHLGLLGAPEGVPALLAALKDPQAAVRINATEALGRLSAHARDAAPVLHPLLADPNLTVRFNAAVLLRKLDGATAGELAAAIAPRLADGDREVREQTFDLLFQLGPSEDAVREALVGALKLGPTEVRREVALRLSRADLELRAGVWVLDLVPPLLDAVDHDLDPKVRLYSVHTLRDLRPYPREVLDGLVRALDDASAEVAGAAATGMNVDPRTVPQRAVAHLMKRLKTGPAVDDRVRAAATMQGLFGVRETLIPALEPFLRADPEPRVRAQVAWTMGELNGTEAIAPLLRALQSDAEVAVRAAAIAGLRTFGAGRLESAGQLEAVRAALRAAAAGGDDAAAAAEAALEALAK
jgi:HEAT repeat protein